MIELLSWPTKAASAEFAPDPALDPLWISSGSRSTERRSKISGQITMKVAPDTDAAPE